MNARIALALLCVAACRNRQSAQPSTADAPGTGRSCHDAMGAGGFVCSDGSVERRGDTLYIRRASGATVHFVDQSTGEAPGGYTYVGLVGHPAYHLVQSNGHEAVPSYILVSPATGRQVSGLDSTAWSPDSTRIATVAESWDNCSEGGLGRIAIWRLTDTLPVREYEETPWRCERGAAWAPTDPRWTDSRSVEFTRVDFPAANEGEAMPAQRLWKKRRVRLVLEAGRWVPIGT